MNNPIERAIRASNAIEDDLFSISIFQLKNYLETVSHWLCIVWLFIVGLKFFLDYFCKVDFPLGSNKWINIVKVLSLVGNFWTKDHSLTSDHQTPAENRKQMYAICNWSVFRNNPSKSCSHSYWLIRFTTSNFTFNNFIMSKSISICPLIAKWVSAKSICFMWRQSISSSLLLFLLGSYPWNTKSLYWATKIWVEPWFQKKINQPTTSIVFSSSNARNLPINWLICQVESLKWSFRNKGTLRTPIYKSPRNNVIVFIITEFHHSRRN